MALVAPAALAVLRQASARWPKRDWLSDGTVGDRRHMGIVSDHNPDSRGVVLAVDLDADLAPGVTAHEWIRWRIAKGDRRIKYAITNGVIWKARTGAWEVYRLENKHTKHVHISIEQRWENDVSPWFDGFLSPAPPPPVTKPPPAPLPQEDDMAVQFIVTVGSGQKLVVIDGSGTTVVPIVSPADSNALASIPLKVIGLSTAQVTAIETA